MRNTLRGIGSILDIMPASSSTDYSRFVPKETPEERIRQTWQRVGDNIRIAMGRFSDEHEASEEQQD